MEIQVHLVCRAVSCAGDRCRFVWTCGAGRRNVATGECGPLCTTRGARRPTALDRANGSLAGAADALAELHDR